MKNRLLNSFFRAAAAFALLLAAGESGFRKYVELCEAEGA